MSRLHTIIVMDDTEVDLDHLADVMFVRCLHCKIIPSPPSLPLL